MQYNNMKEKIEKLISLVGKIPQEFWSKTDGEKYEVVWLLDRQKPSVEPCYDFDEERLGITKDGRVIWGFDSGCSCPTPWSAGDFGDENYKTNTYKEFFITLPEFDKDWDVESSAKIDLILSKICEK